MSGAFFSGFGKYRKDDHGEHEQDEDRDRDADPGDAMLLSKFFHVIFLCCLEL